MYYFRKKTFKDFFFFFLKHFSDTDLNSSTFQACANPVQDVVVQLALAYSMFSYLLTGLQKSCMTKRTCTHFYMTYNSSKDSD